MKYNRSSNKVMALASAMLAITFGHTYEWWRNNDEYATAKNVNSRKVWAMASHKATKKFSPTPDTPPTTPKAQTPPTAPRPNVVKMAKVSYTRRLNNLGTRNERVIQSVA